MNDEVMTPETNPEWWDVKTPKWDAFRKALEDYCKINRQPERLNPETSKEDAIV